jgi:hypothetical protein
VLFKLFLSTVEWSIWNVLAHILHTAEFLVPSNLKYPFTYDLHLVHLNGAFTRILCTRYDPKGVIHAPNGKFDFFGLPNINADVGRMKSGPAS